MSTVSALFPVPISTRRNVIALRAALRIGKNGPFAGAGGGAGAAGRRARRKWAVFCQCVRPKPRKQRAHAAACGN
ncbi:MAG: hypothetical protein LBS64_01465, partial [Spirochaetaceae bacterium]|nr:hypothetical protein [Spirochaetaceae bacterium]